MSRRRSRSRQRSRESKHAALHAPVPRMSLAELCQKISTQPDTCVLLLDRIEDPHNLGACLRTADAAGVAAVITPKDKAVSLTETVRRVACGGAEAIPLIQVTNLARAMEKLKEAGVLLVGASHKATRELYDLDLTGPVGMVMGSEGSGLRRLTMDSCHELVKLPMQGAVPCLNISVATGICLFEVVRQRKKKASTEAE